MLAYSSETPETCGRLAEDVHKPLTFLRELLDFITAELPRWRDNPDRPADVAESRLTDSLCSHLNSASRLARGWDVLQFRTEVSDELNAGRKIDLVPKPCGATIWIDGRRHTQFDTLLPIECKRLPTPKETDRDEREYVISQYSTTGGIQRFKAGHHGGAHSLGGMIAYVQAETASFWLERTCQWIRDLAASATLNWTENDLLQLDKSDPVNRVTVLGSRHDRSTDRTNIELRHLWVEMN